MADADQTQVSGKERQYGWCSSRNTQVLLSGDSEGVPPHCACIESGHCLHEEKALVTDPPPWYKRQSLFAR